MQEEIQPKLSYELSELPQEVQEAISSLVSKIFEKYPVTKERLASIFKIKSESILETQIHYYAAYAKAALEVVIVGAFYGERASVMFKGKSSAEMVKEIEGRTSPLMYYDEKVFHEIAHTFISLGRNEVAVPRALAIDFQDFNSVRNPKGSRAMQQRNDEALIDFWDLGRISAQRRTDDALAERKTADEFAEIQLKFLFDGDLTDTYAVNLCKEIYEARKKGETAILWDIFVRLTFSFMQVRAPKIASELLVG